MSGTKRKEVVYTRLRKFQSMALSLFDLRQAGQEIGEDSKVFANLCGRRNFKEIIQFID